MSVKRLQHMNLVIKLTKQCGLVVKISNILTLRFGQSRTLPGSSGNILDTYKHLYKAPYHLNNSLKTVC